MASPAGPAGFAPSPSWLVGPKPHQPGRTPARGWPPWRRAGGRGGGAGGGGAIARAPRRAAHLPWPPETPNPDAIAGPGARPARRALKRGGLRLLLGFVWSPFFLSASPKENQRTRSPGLGLEREPSGPLGRATGPSSQGPSPPRTSPKSHTTPTPLSPRCRSPQAGRRRVVVGATTRGAGPRDSSGLRRAFTLLLHTAAKKGHARTADSRTAPRRAACARRRLTSPRPGPPGSGP